MLDRLVLVACILIVLALIVYFFYWNRILGFMISCVLRILYWNQEASSCWIEIGQLVVSIEIHAARRNFDRLNTLFLVSGTHIAKGRSLSLQQPDDKDCQESNSVAVLDPEANDSR